VTTRIFVLDLKGNLRASQMKIRSNEKSPSSLKNTYEVFATLMRHSRDIFTTMPHDSFVQKNIAFSQLKPI
jgi:hypothetical protein